MIAGGGNNGKMKSEVDLARRGVFGVVAASMIRAVSNEEARDAAGRPGSMSRRNSRTSMGWLP
jgi:hypothetical protein